MRPREIFTGLGCSIRAVPFQIRIRQYSTQRPNPSSRNLSSRQSSSKTKTSASQAAAHKLLQPLILHLSTTYNYTPQKSGKGKGKSDKMRPQSIQIPGLTLLNNLTPHAIAPTSEGGFISTAPAPKSQAAATTKKAVSTTTATTTIPPPKKKENKKAKARRLLAEAQAQAQAPANHNHNGYAQPPNQPYNPNGFRHNNSNNNAFMRTPPTGPRILTKDSPRDQRVAPSKASGGIPEPTPRYVAHSLTPSSSLRQPRRIFVIMDLNGTLLYRPNKRNPFNFIQRPHAREFLDYCIETFHVAIWSSARPENVDKMVAQLLSPAQRAKCVVIWGRDQLGLSPADYSARVQVYKRLTAIWNDPRVLASHPAAAHGQRWDQTNTVLVDDSAEKGRSEPFNILQLPEFEGLNTEPLDVLPQVHDYLNTLCYQTNISSYIRDRPFKINPSYTLMPSQDFHMG
ncbi:HAD-like domain-containing protein [Trichoderma evansii]